MMHAITRALEKAIDLAETNARAVERRRTVVHQLVSSLPS